MHPQPTRSAPSPIRLLALDLDETLLDRNRAISPGNQRALAAVQALGVRVILASGRPPAGLLPHLTTLGLHQREGHAIACNGGLIMALPAWREVWSVCLEPALLAEAWDQAADLRQPVQTYAPAGILVSQDNPVTRKDSRLTGLPWKVVDRAGFLAEPRIKVLLPGASPDLDPVEARFRAVFQGRANLSRSRPRVFEVMPLEADKGLALARIAALEGIPQQHVMAIGDSWNDEGMLRWAGVSVAMANAPAGIQQLATWVTSRGHDDDGVAEAVERYLL